MTSKSNVEKQAELTERARGDWSWSEREYQRTPKGWYVYSEIERARWHIHNEMGFPLELLQPWSFPAYRGLPERPQRIGVTR